MVPLTQENARDDRSRSDERAELARRESRRVPEQTARMIRRTAKRDARVAEGLALAQSKLEDVVRLGLNSSVVNDWHFWRDFARMASDIQAPGLALFFADAPRLLGGGAPGYDELLIRLGRLELLIEAARRIDLADEDFAAEIRQALGYTVRVQDVLAYGERVAGRWLAVGRREWSSAKRIWNSREWYYETKSGRFAEVRLTTKTRLTRQRPFFEDAAEVGTLYEGAMRFYPGSLRRRATPESPFSTVAPPFTLRAKTTLEQFFERLPRIYARAPWTSHIPALVEDAVVRAVWRRDENGSGYEWRVASRLGCSAPVFTANESLLERYSCATWDAPGTFFAEWNGYAFDILTLWKDGKIVSDDRKL